MFDVLDDLEAVIDKIAADETMLDVERISRLAERLECQRLRAVAAYDRSCDWAAAGYASTASALRAKTRCSRGHAQRSVNLARKLEHRPETAAALGAGEISREHATLIAGPYTPERAEMLERIEAEVVAFAKIGTPAELRGAMKRITDAYDADCGAASDEAQHKLNQVTLSSTLGGRGVLNGSLDPELAALARADVAHGGRLSRSTLERISCDCKLARIITDGPGQIIDVGRLTRNIPQPLLALGTRRTHQPQHQKSCAGSTTNNNASETPRSRGPDNTDR